MYRLTFQVVSTGGLTQPAWSPCTVEANKLPRSPCKTQPLLVPSLSPPAGAPAPRVPAAPAAVVPTVGRLPAGVRRVPSRVVRAGAVVPGMVIIVRFNHMGYLQACSSWGTTG